MSLQIASIQDARVIASEPLDGCSERQGADSRGHHVPTPARRAFLPPSGSHLVVGGSASTLRRVRASDADDLVERARSGDKVAFRELFRRHRSDVSRLIFRMLGPAGDIEDLVQEVFLQVHRSLADFKGQSKFSTWLHRVTVNVVLMCRRAARSRPVFAGEVSDAEPDRGLMPDEDASRRQRLEAFRRVLERLPEKKRTVFVLHELEGLPPAEISTIVDAPVLTVRTRLFYARREICELMRDEPTLASLAARFGGECDDDRTSAAPDAPVLSCAAVDEGPSKDTSGPKGPNQPKGPTHPSGRNVRGTR